MAEQYAVYAASALILLAICSNCLAISGSMADFPDGKVLPQELLDFAKSQVRMCNSSPL